MHLPVKLQKAACAKCAILCSIVVIVLFSFTSDLSITQLLHHETNVFDSAWSQHLGDEVIALDDLDGYQDVAAGEPLILSCVLPTLTEEKTFFFYTKDVEVWVYLDDTLVYSFVMEDDFAFLQTPGNAWHSVVLSTQNSGQTLHLVLGSAFDNRYETTLSTLYLVCPTETLSVLLSRDRLRIIMSFVLFIMALVAYVDTFLWNRKVFKQFFFALGNLYFATTLWLFGMYGYLDYFFHQPIVSYLVSMLAASLIPAMVYELLKSLTSHKSPVFLGMGCLVWGSLGLQIVLQFVFGVSLLSLLPLTALVYVVGSVGCIAMLVWMHLPKHRPTEKNPLHFARATTLVMFLGALLEIWVMVALPARTELLGVCSVSGLIVYLIINQFAITRMESNIDLEKILIEENYSKLQNTNLIQQIKAHFFFNTLNNISALCKSDPAEADYAINLFARYMRSYMHLIDRQENIPLSQELALVEASLGIEKLRFAGNFDYRLQLDDTDFLVPPLCVQPLIENACKHGLRGHAAGGVVTLCTKRVGNTMLVTVQDNGTGFDPTLLQESESIGLKNLEKRVRLMAGGTLHIESTIGAGTTVTLTFPDAQAPT